MPEQNKFDTKLLCRQRQNLSNTNFALALMVYKTPILYILILGILYNTLRNKLCLSRLSMHKDRIGTGALARVGFCLCHQTSPNLQVSNGNSSDAHCSTIEDRVQS